MPENLANLVASMYDSATGALKWSDLGDRLCRELSADRVYLGIQQDDGTLPNLLGRGDPFDKSYAERFHKVDPLRQHARANPPGPNTPRVVLGGSLAGKPEILRTEYYADYAKPRGVRTSLAGRLGPNGETLIGFFRHAVMRAFDDKEMQRLEFLLPHLTRAIDLHQTLGMQLSAAESAFGLAALHAIPLCVAVVDDTMRLKVVNAAGERLMSRRDAGLRIVRSSSGLASGCHLAASHPEDSRALKALVATAAAQGRGGGLRLRTAGVSGPRAPMVVLLVSPMPASLMKVERRTAPEGFAPGLALVVARDLAQPQLPPPELLSDLFGLSNGEAAVAQAILGGVKAEDVARSRDVSIDTVRSQVRSVLGKTEAANLRDLERIVASLALLRT